MRRLFVLVSTLLAACGSEPSEVNLAGIWHFTFDLDVVGIDGVPIEGAFCRSVEPIRMTLTESREGAFEGSFEGGITACYPGGDADTTVGEPNPGGVINGQISGDEVAFDLIDTSLHQEGHFTEGGRAMSGTATWGTDSDPSNTYQTGTWVAEKQ